MASIRDILLTRAIRYLQKKQKQLRSKKKHKAKKVVRKQKPKKKPLPKKKKPPKKKPPKKKPPKKPPKKRKKTLFKISLKPKSAKAKDDQGEYLGEITHFFSRIKVVVIKIEKGRLKVGDEIYIKGSSSNFKQKVKSIQIESVDVPMAKKGDDFGLKVDKKARVGDKVYLLSR